MARGAVGEEHAAGLVPGRGQQAFAFGDEPVGAAGVAEVQEGLAGVDGEVGFGYPGGPVGTGVIQVPAYQDGSARVGFLVDIGVSPWCVGGTMSSNSTKADAFGGYPDGTGCEPPSGGH